MVLVSVVIPVYGVESYIQETVNSVLSQTYRDFELLIVDDGSPDQSVEICKQFDDGRIKIISQENRGLAGARNTGIRNSQGNYVAFLDGDDLWLPEKLSVHVEHLNKNQNVGISFSSSLIIDEDSKRTGESLNPKLNNINYLDLLKSNPVGNGSAAVVRRRTLDDIAFDIKRGDRLETDYFDETFRRAEDLELWLRILLKTSWQMEGIKPPTTLYRVNSQGLSANFEQQFSSLQKVLDKASSYAPDIILKQGQLATAYQYLYLARSAARLKDKNSSIKFLKKSIASYWKIVLEKPKTIAYCTYKYITS